MSGSASGPALLLAGAGILLVLTGVAGVVLGLTAAERLHAMLPPITADADAVGGAAVALGVACALAGLVHLVLSVALRSPSSAALIAAIVTCAVMAALALVWAVAAIVTAAGGGPGPAILLLGLGMALLAAGYGWAAAVLIALRRAARRPS